MCLIIFKVPVKGISLANGETVPSVTAKCSSKKTLRQNDELLLSAGSYLNLTGNIRFGKLVQSVSQSKINSIYCYLLLFPFNFQV